MHVWLINIACYDIFVSTHKSTQTCTPQQTYIYKHNAHTHACMHVYIR